MGDKDKYLVDGLAHEMEELKLPAPVTRSLHETLGIIRDINGSDVPAEVRHKQLLTLRVTGHQQPIHRQRRSPFTTTTAEVAPWPRKQCQRISFGRAQVRDKQSNQERSV